MNTVLKSLVIAVLMVLPGAGTARGTDPATAPATTVPSDSNAKRFPKWYKECESHLAEMKGKPCDLIFIGDSITYQWSTAGKSVWKKYYANRNAFDFGVGGDRTQSVLWRLETMDVKDLRPKVAVLLIGTNNVSDSPADIAEGVKAVIQKIQQTFPGVKVIFLSILPNGRSQTRMADANKTIQTLGDDKSVFFLDLASKMVRVGHNWKGLGGDKLHLSAEGYELWASEMEPLLARLLDSSSPKAAKKNQPLK